MGMDITDLKHRFSLYGIGFFFGILIVFFFLGGKRASCDWLPNDRVLRMIEKKELQYGPEVQKLMADSKEDSLAVVNALQKGEVDFSKSLVRNEPCRKYWIQSKIKPKLWVGVEVCDSIATVIKTETDAPKSFR